MQQYNDFEAEYREPEKNVLGIVGFALSFCTGPIGLIISLIALAKRPRGFAIAGVIISLISSVVLGLVAWFVIWGAGIGMKVVELGLDYKAVEAAVTRYQGANSGAVPADISALGLSSDQMTDPWGQPYKVIPSADGTTWSMVSAGMDSTFDTPDDFSLRPGMTDDQVSEEVSQKIGKYYEKKFGN